MAKTHTSLLATVMYFASAFMSALSKVMFCIHVAARAWAILEHGDEC